MTEHRRHQFNVDPKQVEDYLQSTFERPKISCPKCGSTKAYTRPGRIICHSSVCSEITHTETDAVPQK